MDLELLQKDVARQVGVTKDTVRNWERNRTEPALPYVPRVTKFLGYAPDDPHWPFGTRLRTAQRRLGLPQKQFAAVIGIDQGTLSRWMRGRSQPHGRLLTRVRPALARLGISVS